MLLLLSLTLILTLTLIVLPMVTVIVLLMLMFWRLSARLCRCLGAYVGMWVCGYEGMRV
jgi:hypothetical protein